MESDLQLDVLDIGEDDCDKGNVKYKSAEVLPEDQMEGSTNINC